MVHRLGEQVRKQFIARLDLNKMKLAAIRVDYESLNKNEKNRGDAQSQSATVQNFVLVFGCRPGKGVKANTKMVKEFTKTMLEKYEMINFSLTFSEVFENLHSNDANFEMASSNTTQPLKIFYRYNIVTDKIAVVFVSGSKIKTHVGHGWEQQFPGFAKTAKDLLKKDLEFSDVTVWTDLSKSSIIEKLDLIKCLADDFEHEKNKTLITETAKEK